MSSAEIVTIISALSVAVVSIISAWRTNDKVQQLTDTSERSANTADKKLDKIHELTNSNLTTVKTDLTIANERIAKLESLIQNMAKGESSKEEEDEALEEAVKKPAKAK